MVCFSACHPHFFEMVPWVLISPPGLSGFGDKMESMAHSFIITQDLPDPGLLPQVVRLFYEAFALKIHHLELFACDRAQAERLLARSFRPELGLFAHRGAELGGLLGLEYARGPRFFGVRYPILRAEFGAAGALWRWGWLTLSHLYQRPRPGEKAGTDEAEGGFLNACPRAEPGASPVQPHNSSARMRK